jgi:hypothetical protein
MEPRAFGGIGEIDKPFAGNRDIKPVEVLW